MPEGCGGLVVVVRGVDVVVVVRCGLVVVLVAGALVVVVVPRELPQPDTNSAIASIATPAEKR
jgi:hypothetical protein